MTKDTVDPPNMCTIKQSKPIAGSWDKPPQLEIADKLFAAHAKYRFVVSEEMTMDLDGFREAVAELQKLTKEPT